MTSALARVDRLRAEIEAASTVEELRELRAKAKAVRDYLVTKRGPLDADARRVAGMLVLVNRRLGEMLAAFVSRGYKSDTKIPDGISRVQSSKWQRLADIPDDVFEKYLATAQEPSVNGALKYATNHEGATAEATTGMCSGEDLERLIQTGAKFRTIKAAAIASYAKQAQDESLMQAATRIKAQAIRRCGELLKQIEKATGQHLKRDATDQLSSGQRRQIERVQYQLAGSSRRPPLRGVHDTRSRHPPEGGPTDRTDPRSWLLREPAKPNRDTGGVGA